MTSQFQTQQTLKTTTYPQNTAIARGCIQRKCACGQHTGAGGECEECKKKRMQGSPLQENVAPAERLGAQRFSHRGFAHERFVPERFVHGRFVHGRFVHDFSSLRTHAPVLFEEDLRGQPEPDGEAGPMPTESGIPTDISASPLDSAQPTAAVQTGETACDVDTGKATASTANTNECTKECSMAHEKIHVADISACCAKAHQAKQKATTDEEKNKVHDRMKEWVDVNRPFLECRGYTESVNCAEKKLKALQCETASPRPKCCTPLVWYIRSATQNRDANCNNAGKSLTACPF